LLVAHDAPASIGSKAPSIRCRDPVSAGAS
jgi:hypothetical protein